MDALHQALNQRGASYLFRNATTDSKGYILPIQQADAERLARELSNPRYSHTRPVTAAHVRSFVAHARAERLRAEDVEEQGIISLSKPAPTESLFQA